MSGRTTKTIIRNNMARQHHSASQTNESLV